MLIISYIVTAITLIGTIANAFKKRWSFIIWICTNVFWMIYNFYIHQPQQAIIYMTNIITSIIGLIYWKKENKMESVIKWKVGNPPNKTGRYLVTYSTGNVETCLWSNAAHYFGDKQSVYSWLSPEATVVAYAELPEPYKVEEDNK